MGNTICVSTWTFIIISFWGLSCFLGGHLSTYFGSRKVAAVSLFISGLCCLLSLLFFQCSPFVFLLALCMWCMAVTADSPQFSSLVAAAAEPKLKGNGLTLVNCIGFAISIVSIELLSILAQTIDPTLIFITLGTGPILGLFSLKPRGLTLI